MAAKPQADLAASHHCHAYTATWRVLIPNPQSLIPSPPRPLSPAAADAHNTCILPRALRRMLLCLIFRTKASATTPSTAISPSRRRWGLPRRSLRAADHRPSLAATPAADPSVADCLVGISHRRAHPISARPWGPCTWPAGQWPGCSRACAKSAPTYPARDMSSR